MSKILRAFLPFLFFATPMLSFGAACEFVDAPTLMSEHLKKMGDELKSILATAGGNSEKDRPECRALAEHMSAVVANPETNSADDYKLKGELVNVSTRFFQLGCDQWVGEAGTTGLAVTSLGVARSFLASAALVPSFQLPVLAVGTLTDLVFGALERLFRSRSMREQLEDHDKIFDQQALLCAYFEHVTQVDETLTDGVLRDRRSRALNEIFQRQEKIQALERQISACVPNQNPPQGNAFDWENWKKIKGQLNDGTPGDQYFSVLEAIDTAEWKSEIAKAISSICSPDQNPKPTQTQREVCALHKRLDDLLAAPPPREQGPIIAVYNSLIAGLERLQLFPVNSSGPPAPSELERLQADLFVERELLKKLETETQTLSDNDEVRRAGIFDRIRFRGKEILTGSSSEKGVLRKYLDTLQESIERSTKQISRSELLSKLRRKEIQCSDLIPLQQPAKSAEAHTNLVLRVCERFAGATRPEFRDRSLSFSQIDPRLNEHCREQKDRAMKQFTEVTSLRDKLYEYEPIRSNCPELVF